MLKMVRLLKRRPGMSLAAFRRYDEPTHRVIGEKHLTPCAARYLRRYLNPHRGPGSGCAMRAHRLDTRPIPAGQPYPGSRGR